MNISTVNLDILQLAEGLGIGESRRSICPFCENKEKSFSVTNQGHIVLYNCFRLKCGEKGSLKFNGKGIYKEVEKTNFNPPSLMNLDKESLEFFAEKYEIKREYLEVNKVKITTDRQWFYFPRIFSGIFGACCYQLKKTPWNNQKNLPKWINNECKIHKGDFGCGQVGIGSCERRYGTNIREIFGRAVLVEDAISAIKIAAGPLMAYYCLGTVLNTYKILRLRETKILIAFDPDAKAKAVSYKLMYSGLGIDIKVALLDKDPKDMSYPEIEDKILSLCKEQS